VVQVTLTYPFISSCAFFKSQAYVQNISALAEVKIYIRDTPGKNTTDVLRTHNVDKTCILPAGILALFIRRAYRILSGAPFIVLSGCTIFFPHYFINGTISGEKNIIEHKMYVSIASKNFVQNTSHSTNHSSRYYRKCALVFMSYTSYSCHISIKLEFSR